MLYSGSTQRTLWTHISPAAPAPTSDKALAVRSYAKVVQVLGEKAKLRREVVLTAMAYVRRYFYRGGEELMSRPVCEDALLLAVTAFYLAGKVEEEELANHPESRGVDMTELVKLAKPNKPDEQQKLETQAIKFEMEFLAHINFDLLCFHPLRPSVGFLDAWYKNKANTVVVEEDYEAAKAALWQYVSGAYLVDNVMFAFPSSTLGLTCMVCALRRIRRGKSKSNVPDPVGFQSALRALLVDEEICGAMAEDDADLLVSTVLELSNRLELGMNKELDVQAKAAYQKWRGTTATGGGASLAPSTSPTPEQQ